MDPVCHYSCYAQQHVQSRADRRLSASFCSKKKLPKVGDVPQTQGDLQPIICAAEYAVFARSGNSSVRAEKCNPVCMGTGSTTTAMHEYVPMQTTAPSMPLCSFAAVPRVCTGNMLHPTRLPPRPSSRFPTGEPPKAVGRRSVRSTAQACHAVRPCRSPKAPTAQAHVSPRALSPAPTLISKLAATGCPSLPCPSLPRHRAATAWGTPAPLHVAEQLGPGSKGGRRASRPLTQRAQRAQRAQHSALTGRSRVKPSSRRHAHASLLAPVETDSHTRVSLRLFVLSAGRTVFREQKKGRRGRADREARGARLRARVVRRRVQLGKRGGFTPIPAVCRPGACPSTGGAPGSRAGASAT